VRETRRPLESTRPDTLADFDTSAELLYRFVAEFIGYTETCASLAHRSAGRERTVARYVNKTNRFVVAFAFLRTAVVMAVVGWFWIATDWPGGGLGLIGAALTCALTSSAPNPSRLAVQMAVGATLATMTGYLYSCYVYPNIDGFPLLCATLTPALALGAWLASQPRTTGYGLGFSVFFCLLAGPDNVVAYAPELLINNGLAIVSSMLVAAVAFAAVFPSQMTWLLDIIRRDLRCQVVLACKGKLDGLNPRFQSSTHDLMYQLRMLLKRQSRKHRHALRWMLITLEVGHAMIDLRHEVARVGYAARLHPRWSLSLQEMGDDIARLFERPDARLLERALVSVRSTTWIAQQILDAVHTDRDKRHDLQRILGCLHFIRTALLDKDAPFNAR
jgi:uncharacterized membrane protein YccC